MLGSRRGGGAFQPAGTGDGACAPRLPAFGFWPRLRRTSAPQDLAQFLFVRRERRALGQPDRAESLARVPPLCSQLERDRPPCGGLLERAVALLRGARELLGVVLRGELERVD